MDELAGDANDILCRIFLDIAGREIELAFLIACVTAVMDCPYERSLSVSRLIFDLALSPPTRITWPTPAIFESRGCTWSFRNW